MATLAKKHGQQAINEGTAELRRDVGFWLFLFYGLGNIIGAGIYVLIGKVAGAALGAPSLSMAR